MMFDATTGVPLILIFFHLSSGVIVKTFDIDLQPEVQGGSTEHRGKCMKLSKTITGCKGSVYGDSLTVMMDIKESSERCPKTVSVTIDRQGKTKDKLYTNFRTNKTKVYCLGMPAIRKMYCFRAQLVCTKEGKIKGDLQLTKPHDFEFGSFSMGPAKPVLRQVR